MTNAMMGGALLVLPLIFTQCGFISSSIILAIVGYISFKTANIYVVHMKVEEQDVADSVKRILGKGWWALFIILACSMLLLLMMIYYLMMNDMIYKVSQFFFYHAEFENYAHKDEFTFNKFSMTYVSVAQLILCGVFIFIKDQSIFVKMSEYGIYSIYVYIIFIFYVFFNNVEEKNFMKDVKLFSTDISEIGKFISFFFI